MSRLHLLISLGAVMSGGVTTSAIAQSSECRDGLVKNTISENYNRDQALAFLRFSTSEERTQRQKQRGGSGSLFDWVDINVDDQSSDQTVKSKMDLMGYTLNESEALNFFVSTVSDEARAGFYECIRRERGAPFYLTLNSISQFRSTSGRLLNRAILRIVRPHIPGVATTTMKLVWGSNIQSLAQRLSRDIPDIGPSGELAATNVVWDPAVGLEISARHLNTASADVSIPARPTMVADSGPPWKRDQYSIPIKFTAHLSGRGDECKTINIDDTDRQEPSECPISLDGSVGSSKREIQELTINWDLIARQTQRLPFQLTSKQLSLEYYCAYRPSVLHSNSVRYPSSGWMPLGDRCGDESGEPKLTTFALRLAGDLKDEFVLTYDCWDGRANIPARGGDPCITTQPSGFRKISIEIDSIPGPSSRVVASKVPTDPAEVERLNVLLPVDEPLESTNEWRWGLVGLGLFGAGFFAGAVSRRKRSTEPVPKGARPRREKST